MREAVDTGCAEPATCEGKREDIIHAQARFDDRRVFGSCIFCDCGEISGRQAACHGVPRHLSRLRTLQTLA